MGAELVVDAVVVAFAEQVQVEVGELRREVIRIVLRAPARRCDSESAAGTARSGRRYGTRPSNRPSCVQLRQLDDALRRRLPSSTRDCYGVGLEHAHDADGGVVRRAQIRDSRAPSAARGDAPARARRFGCGEFVIAATNQSNHRAAPRTSRSASPWDSAALMRRCAPYLTRSDTGLMRQIRSAYSRTLRSLEKMPMFSAFSGRLAAPLVRLLVQRVDGCPGHGRRRRNRRARNTVRRRSTAARRRACRRRGCRA